MLILRITQNSNWYTKSQINWHCCLRLLVRSRLQHPLHHPLPEWQNWLCQCHGLHNRWYRGNSASTIHIEIIKVIFSNSLANFCHARYLWQLLSNQTIQRACGNEWTFIQNSVSSLMASASSYHKPLSKSWFCSLTRNWWNIAWMSIVNYDFFFPETCYSI